MCSICSAQATVINAYGSGNDTFYDADYEAASLSLITGGPNFYHLDFAPDGTLYGLSRRSDRLYRFDDLGNPTELTALGTDSGGGAFSVTPDGQFIYYRAWDGLNTPHKLYRYTIATNTIDDLGSINDRGLRYATDFEFAADGTLYALSSEGASLDDDGCWENLQALYTVDVATKTSTRVSDFGMGLQGIGCRSYIDNLDYDANGFLHMTVNDLEANYYFGDGYLYYQGRIDLDTNEATRFNRYYSLDGSGGRLRGGLELALQTTAVPLPAAVWLFGSGLAALGWMRRKG